MAYELPVKYGSRKSFYGKARVEVVDGRQILYSYGTKVAEVYNGKAKVYGLYSDTTTRHIKEFLLQNGFKAESGKQIIKDYSADKQKETFVAPKIERSSNKPTIYDVGEVRIFKIDKDKEIQAVSEKTRNGFRHRATLVVDGTAVDETKANYLNRTWESYEYESVVNSLINKSSYISPTEKEKLKNKFQEASHKKVEEQFKTVGQIAQLGELFGQSLEEKNKFKLRMLKAGLGEGFQVPDDWDKLSEEEKAKRLDKAIKLLKDKE